MFGPKEFLRVIRSLAKQHKWQTIYVQAKELNFNLFINNIGFTDIQIQFLDYLNYYSSIYMDIALDDIGWVVLDNEVYEDAYMFYKRKVRDKNEVKNDIITNDNTEQGKKISWVFRKPSRK